MSSWASQDLSTDDSDWENKLAALCSLGFQEVPYRLDQLWGSPHMENSAGRHRTCE
jgi:hypothetical protein